MNRHSNSPYLLRFATFFVSAVLVSVFSFIIISALEALYLGRGLFLFSSVWSPSSGKFGIAAMIYASIILSISALCLGWLLAFGCCCVLRGFGSKWLKVCLMGFLRFMTAIPTVVYGFAAVFLLVPLIRDGLGGSGFCWLAAAVMLALQSVPAMALLMDGTMRSAEEETALTSAALGLTPLQNLSRVIIPVSRRGLLAAAGLGFGRTLGDTLLPTMLAGNAIQFAVSPLESLRTLTAHISLVLSSDIGGGENLSLLLAGGLLLLTSITINLISRSLASGDKP